MPERNLPWGLFFSRKFCFHSPAGRTVNKTRGLYCFCVCAGGEKGSYKICWLRGRLFPCCSLLLFLFLNVVFAEHVSVVTGLLLSCIIELLTCNRVSRVAYFCNGAQVPGHIQVLVFTLRSTVLSVRPC